MTFITIFKMRPIGSFTDFFLAFKLLFEKTERAHQAEPNFPLAETCWIRVRKDNQKFPLIPFHTAISIAENCGIIINDDNNNLILNHPPIDIINQASYFAKLTNELEKLKIRITGAEFSQMERLYQEVAIAIKTGGEPPEIADSDSSEEKTKKLLIKAYQELLIPLAD